MKFDYSINPTQPIPSPEYNQPYGTELPPIQARSNMSYLQFIDVIDYLWSQGHPEIRFSPVGAASIFDPELAYIIYSLEDKKPKANHPKPKLYEIKQDVNDPSKKVAVFIENFNIMVKFTAIHKNPRVAEELIEEFENFIIEMTPVLRMNGLESLLYARRLSDSHESRYGDDISSRSIAYMIGVQKMLTTDVTILDSVSIQIQAVLNGDATPSYSATPSYDIHASLLDNYTSK